jgi:subtilase family serine protease
MIHPMASRSRMINDKGWSLEQALDIQVAHGIAPDASILLVQAKSSNILSVGGSGNRTSETIWSSANGMEQCKWH